MTVRSSGLDSIQVKNLTVGLFNRPMIFPFQPMLLGIPLGMLRLPVRRSPNQALDYYQGEGDWMDFLEELEPFHVSSQLEESVFSR